MHGILSNNQIVIPAQCKVPSSASRVEDVFAIFRLEHIAQKVLVMRRAFGSFSDVELPNFGGFSVGILIGQT